MASAERARGLWARNPSLVPGMEVGDCILRRVLERGPSETLWLADQPKLGRTVTIKVFEEKEFEASHLAWNSSQRVEALASLDHPALAMVYRLGMEENFRYLVGEYVEGERMNRVLHRWSAPADIPQSTLCNATRFNQLIPKLLNADGGWIGTVARWGHALSSGLDACHRVGIGHHALWSGNILVDIRGNARLVDFWLESAFSPRELPQLKGYLAPEVELRERPTAQSDVFSLGVVLYRCLAGALPFPVVQSPGGEMVFFDRKPPRIRNSRPEIPRRLERILLKAVATDQQDRWRSAGDMARAFASFHADWVSGSIHSGWLPKLKRRLWQTLK